MVVMNGPLDGRDDGSALRLYNSASVKSYELPVSRQNV